VPKKAQKLLDKARRTSSGWTINELKALYEGFGFNIIHKGNHDFAQHSTNPDLLDTLPRHNKVKDVYVKNAIDKIEKLLARESQKADTESEV